MHDHQDALLSILCAPLTQVNVESVFSDLAAIWLDQQSIVYEDYNMKI